MFRSCILLLALHFSSTNAYFLSEEECLNYTVYPVQYELTIIPYIYKDRSYYDCEISITVIANAPNVQLIELDAKDLEIKSEIKVLDGDRDIINRFRPYEWNSNLGKLYIHLQEPLRQWSVDKTQYSIRINFRKYVRSDGSGVFMVPYDDGGATYMLATRLSPNKARYFFPCFDNPQFEAVFKFRVYLVPPSDGLQLTNTSLVVASEQSRYVVRDNNIVIDYVPSPQVAVHQVGFHYSQFSHRQVSARTTNDTLVFWAPQRKLLFYDFIMRFGGAIMNLINDYSTVNRRWVNGPINVVGIPSNVDGYEVGSWNLLTNGDKRLAYVPQFTSVQQEERMTFELAQQLCRIWLGNPGELQRTRWREEWFKEGVATYLAYYFLTQHQHGANTMKYKWPINEYGLQIKHIAMANDWHHSTPALATFNRTLAVEIPSRYKELVALKTASILWMVENWIGSEKFHSALVKYINMRRGKHVSLDEFMTSLDMDTVECLSQFFNGSTASKVLNSWFHQPGYPVINVNVLRDRTPNVIQLTQHQYHFGHDNRGDSHYLIPISYIVQNNENCFNCYRPRFTIDSTYNFKENLNGGWIILNRNASGYYRVNYDTDTWKLIAKTLKENHLSIDEQNRAQIANDVFALYAAGMIKHPLAIEILDYLDNELSPVVWDSVISGFELLKTEDPNSIMSRYLYEDWQDFMRNKVANLYIRLSNNIEQPRRTRLFRSNIINFACYVGYHPCLRDLKGMHDEYRRGRQKLDPDTREASYVMLYQQSDINFERQGFNLFEVEDKHLAVSKMRKEKHFLYWIPKGSPVMDRLIMSSTPQPEPPASEIPVESQTFAPEQQAGRSPSNISSLLTIALSVVITLALRLT